MSDLVERVARAMCAEAGVCPDDWWTDAANPSVTNFMWQDFEGNARAAIKAVAEWVREAGGDDMYARAFSKMIFDELKEGSE